MEPVFMMLGQSAATAAVQSLNDGSGLHDLDYSKLHDQLVADGQRLDVDLDQYPPLPPDDEPPVRRSRLPAEPVIEGGCMVTLED